MIRARPTGESVENRTHSKQSVFRKQDVELRSSIGSRWNALVDDYWRPISSGAVLVEFKSHADGRVTDVEIVKTTVGAKGTAFCLRAIKESAPFSSWTPEMKRHLPEKDGEQYQKVKFTFNYD